MLGDPVFICIMALPFITLDGNATEGHCFPAAREDSRAAIRQGSLVSALVFILLAWHLEHTSSASCRSFLNTDSSFLSFFLCYCSFLYTNIGILIHLYLLLVISSFFPLSLSPLPSIWEIPRYYFLTYLFFYTVSNLDFILYRKLILLFHKECIFVSWLLISFLSYYYFISSCFISYFHILFLHYYFFLCLLVAS